MGFWDAPDDMQQELEGQLLPPKTSPFPLVKTETNGGIDASPIQRAYGESQQTKKPILCSVRRLKFLRPSR